MPWWGVLLIGIACVLAGLAGGFFGAVKYFKNYQKKNPAISEAQIRAMLQSMGQPASEKRIRQIMKSMQEADKNRK